MVSARCCYPGLETLVDADFYISKLPPTPRWTSKLRMRSPYSNCFHNRKVSGRSAKVVNLRFQSRFTIDSDGHYIYTSKIHNPQHVPPSYVIIKFPTSTPLALTLHLRFTPTPVAARNISIVASPPPTITIGIGCLRGKPFGVVCVESSNGRMRWPSGKVPAPPSSPSTSTSSSAEETTTTSCSPVREGA